MREPVSAAEIYNNGYNESNTLFVSGPVAYYFVKKGAARMVKNKLFDSKYEVSIVMDNKLVEHYTKEFSKEEQAIDYINKFK